MNVIKEYPTQKIEVEAEKIRKYSYGINEDRDEHTTKDDSKIVAPPLYATVLSVPYTPAPLFDQELNLGLNVGRLVHGEQDTRIFRLLKPGEKITATVKFLGIEEKETGRVVRIYCENRDEKGELVAEGFAGYFIRGEKKGDKKKEEPPVAYGRKIFERVFNVLPDQSLRYAEGSGDTFPIHTDENFAKSMGLPTIILHGLCTMAFATKAVVDEYTKAPSKIRRVNVRFSKMVFPNDVLTFTGFESTEKGEVGKKVINIEAKNQRGEDVLKNAFVEVD